MNYTVTWTRGAEDGLAVAWIAASDQTAVTAASQRLDLALRRDPRIFGESRSTTMVRIAIATPLGIEFEIIEDDKKVRVLRV